MGQTEKAEAVLQEAQRKLSPEQASLVLARGNEALGRLKEAEKLYQAALAAKPDDVPVLRHFAEFYVRTNRLLEARPLLEKLIALTSKDPKETLWARKALAIILASAGNAEQKRQALELLKNVGGGDPQDPTPAASVEDLRARALVLAAQRGREERRRAIGLLESVSGRQPSADDQFLLAQLYEAVGNWPKAHERLLGLLGMPDVKPAQLAAAARRLLHHDAVGEAGAFLTKLKEVAKTEKLDSQDLTVVEIEARVRNAQGQGEEAAALLKKAVAGKDERALGAAATLLEEFGRAKDAEAMYRQYVDRAKRPANALLLAQFLARQHRPEEALELCERAWPACPAALVAEASTAVLSTAGYDPRLGQRVEERLQEALKKNPKDTAVALNLAALRNLQGRSAEAEAIYREVLAANPRNVVALNNLAWLLAQQPGKPADEALELINRAREIAGPVPTVLDTRAVIYHKLGQAGPAALDLEEALATAPSASKYFHLAQAYQLDPQRKSDAVDALRKAKALVRKGETIDPTERKTYDQLVRELDPHEK
jgi:tetratricopeptide (TPR) repeat protein